LNVLVIGNGGREHAISYKFAQNKMVNTVYCAPGNGGSFLEEKCININLSTVEELKKFALDKSIDYTFVGPEVYLTLGVVDEFKAAGLKVFGPDKMAAELEGSKAYAKDFMKKYHVKTAFSETFTDYEQAISYIETC
jgi:phosphoribosylamine---glycine ligase